MEYGKRWPHRGARRLDSWIDVDLGSTTPRLTRAEFRSNPHTIIRVLKADGARVVYGIHPDHAGQALVCGLLADELVKHVL